MWKVSLRNLKGSEKRIYSNCFHLLHTFFFSCFGYSIPILYFLIWNVVEIYWFFVTKYMSIHLAIDFWGVSIYHKNFLCSSSKHLHFSMLPSLLFEHLVNYCQRRIHARLGEERSFCKVRLRALSIRKPGWEVCTTVLALKEVVSNTRGLLFIKKLM